MKSIGWKSPVIPERMHNQLTVWYVHERGHPQLSQGAEYPTTLLRTATVSSDKAAGGYKRLVCADS